MREIYQFNYGDEVLLLQGSFKGRTGFVVNAYGVKGSGYAFNTSKPAIGVAFSEPKIAEATEAVTLDQILLVSAENPHNIQPSPYFSNPFENERSRVVTEEPLKVLMDPNYFSSEQLYTAQRNRIKELFGTYVSKKSSESGDPKRTNGRSGLSPL